MKFSTFFGKFTLCTLIYSIISIGFGIAIGIVLSLSGKKAEKESVEDDPMIAKYLKLNSTK